ncbi:MAG: GDSL-type esterase/lipase family protein [Vicingaceae bacterium]
MNFKLYIPTLILALLSNFSFAQSNPHLLPEHNFVVYDSLDIKYYNDSSNYNTFFGKLDNLIFNGKGKVRVMQIGGSHIQADIWSDQIRKNFQTVVPSLNGGRGFLFPYRLAHTNNPYYYKCTSTGEWKGFRNSLLKQDTTWGVSGITASTVDSAATLKFYFRGDDTPYYDFNSIKIFHNVTDTNYCIELISDTCSSIIVNEEIGYTEFILDHYVDSFEFNIYRNDTITFPFNLYGISLDNNDPGVIYTSVGVNGASTKSYLRCDLFTQHLKAVNPDLVIFCIGINDAYDPNFCENCYENNYDTIVSWIKKVNPNAEFLFVTNNDSYYKRRYPNKRVFGAKNAMIRLANKHNAGLWDMFEVMGGLGSCNKWIKNGYAKKDKIHLTKNGYVLMGDLMFSSIMNEFDNYLKLKTDVIPSAE